MTSGDADTPQPVAFSPLPITLWETAIQGVFPMSQTVRHIVRSGQSQLDLGVSAASSPDADMPDPVRRRELGQYFTPVWAAEALVERFFPDLFCMARCAN